jgi:pimeloyl-ACP methyl ester carboxylesterase
MSERKATIAGVLIASMSMGCSYERNIGKAAPASTPPQSHAGVIDHFVPHISTEPANEGSRVSLFMRERRGASSGPAVLLVHGRSAAALPSFDLEYRDYSWMAYLADVGFDVFAVDLQGYGSSSKPSVMDDPCNTSADNQTKYLIPKPLTAPCPPAYPHPFGSFSTDWDEIDTVVQFIRSLRGDRTLKVNLVGWSRGGMRVIGYAALRPNNVEKVVALNPTRFPPDPTVRDYPINMTDERDFFAAWDQQIDSRNCPDQVDPTIRQVLWNSTIALDKLGSRWGSGVRRSPSFTAAGWTPDLPGRVQAPTLVIRGALDSQAPEPATRALYDALGGPKAYLTVSCGSHELVYEKQHTTLLHASAEWLRHGATQGRSLGSNQKPTVIATDAPAGTETLPVEWVRVAVRNLGVMQAAVARPKGTGPFPAVLILHGTHGFARQYVEWANDMARSGLIAVAACWFSGGGGAGAYAVTPPIPCPEIPPLGSGEYPAAVQLVDALAEATRALPGVRADRLAIIGRSRGGGAVLQYVLAGGNVQAAVLHSAGYALRPGTRAGEFNVPILILHGTTEPAGGGSANNHVALARDFETALRRHQKAVEASYYEGGGHNSFFTNPAQHDDELKTMIDFLRRHVGK